MSKQRKKHQIAVKNGKAIKWCHRQVDRHYRREIFFAVNVRHEPKYRGTKDRGRKWWK